MEYENWKTLTHQLMAPQTLKAVIQFLVLVSVFSLIYYSKYSSRCCFMLHSLKFYLSAIPLHALDKGWIFLICNGIFLVILSNTSSLVSSPYRGLGDGLRTTEDQAKDEWLAQGKGEVLLLEAAEPTENSVSEVVEEEEKENGQESLDEQGDEFSLIEENHEEQELGSCGVLKLEGGESEAEAEGIRTFYILEDDHQENEENLEAAGFLLAEEAQVEEEEDEEEGHGMEKLSAEELNKKFEDFIRKMKEDLRIEAQQQLVVVVK